MWIYVYLFVISLLTVHHISAKCASHKPALCCTGHDSNCFTFELFGNEKMGRQIKCFCDEHCLRTKDCCSDYKEVCSQQKVDCIMSNWADWSSCSKTCNTGVQRRKRKVLVTSRNGGKPCEAIEQARVCQLKHCSVISAVSLRKGGHRRHWRHTKRIKEDSYKNTVHILPELSISKELFIKYHRKSGIRGHIPTNDENDFNTHTNSSNQTFYCVKYRVTYSAPNCRQWYKLSKSERPFWIMPSQWLRRGQHLCLNLSCNHEYRNRCQGTKPSGGLQSLGAWRKWRAIRSDNCYGFFKVVEQPQQCHCHPGPSSYLII